MLLLPLNVEMFWGGSKDFQCDVVVHVSGHSKISGSLWAKRKAKVTQSPYSQGLQASISECTTHQALKQNSTQSFCSSGQLWTGNCGCNSEAHKSCTPKGWKNFALCDESRFLLQHFQTQIRTEFCVNNMKKRILSVLKFWGGGVVMFFWYTLGPNNFL